MKTLRITMTKPFKGHGNEVAAVLEKLDAFLATQPGFIESYGLADDADPEVVGRVGIWESQAAADHAANQVHTIALRARLHTLAGPVCDERLLKVVSERRSGERQRLAA